MHGITEVPKKNIAPTPSLLAKGERREKEYLPAGLNGIGQ